MLFTTPFFLFVFLPVFLAAYWRLPVRRATLFIGSLVFYAWGEPVFVGVVLVSALADWWLGRRIYALSPGHGSRQLLVGIGVAANLGVLIYFKYVAFAVGNFRALLGLTASPWLNLSTMVLPLGVSFIVFEKITYLIDLYRGVAAPAAALLDYLNYVLLFPKLLAGPIVKYHDIAAQLVRPSYRYEDVRDGLIRFIHGFAKKVLFADALAPVADRAFGLPRDALDTGTAWLGLLCFTLQIYFDFSGYSDMAIGLARMLGFRLLENFRDPYLATSFTDFWRRWHISLSTWIKEYLYIPLGGNRVSEARSYANLCFCFLLSGLWHGASWNFVLWGCAHGLFLVADRACWLRWQPALPTVVNIALTFLLVMLTWVFFRCPEFTHALDFFRALAGATQAVGNRLPPVATDAIIMLILGCALILSPLLTSHIAAHQFLSPPRRRVLSLAACGLLLFLSVGRMAVSAFQPFLYFRF